ncbi:MAG: helix-turn-helix domain-containing protein [Actinobacteria bacterium]|nr:helix-turn-helix domain-containing protein [Actinomycetota bacterium]
METDPWIENLRYELESLAMSPEELADLCGLNPRTVMNWLSYQSRPYIDSQRKAEEALRMGRLADKEADAQLKKAIFSHPDLDKDGAEHVWKYAFHIILAKRNKA